MRMLLLSLPASIALAAAPVFGTTVVTGPPGLPSVEASSPRASNITGSDTRSVIAPALPPVSLGPDATATRYLLEARRALAANQTGRAQSALEHAETLLLTRSVPIGAANDPDRNPAVLNVNAALRSLASGDTGEAINLIQQTIPMTQQVQVGVPPVMGPTGAWPPWLEPVQ